MISLSVRIHNFLNIWAFLRLILLTLFLQNAALAERGSFEKRQLFSVVFILLLAFEGLL